MSAEAKIIRQSYAQVESNPTLQKNFTYEYVKFGVDDNFPQLLVDLSNRSPINSSIIKNKVMYAKGSGLKAKNEGEGIGMPNLFETFPELIEKVFTDYVTFGAFALQIILNKDRKSYSLYHQDVSRVRIGQFTQTGDAIDYVVCKDYEKIYMFEPVRLKAWGSEKPRYGEKYLLYYTAYTPSMDLYALPDWYSALNYVEADANLGVFYNALIKNNFNPSTAITFPGNYGKEAKSEIMENIGEFCNPESTANVLALWLDGGDVPIISKLDSTDIANQYDSVQATIMQRIISAHRLTSPVLAGLSGSGNLSGNADEIINSAMLYSISVIKDYQNDVLRVLNKFQDINGRGQMEIIDIDLRKELSKSEAEGEKVAEEGFDEEDAKDNEDIKI